MSVMDKDAEKDRKVKTLIELANYHWKEFDGRRLQEWKANFALWAALAAVVGILTWKDVVVHRGIAVWTSIFLLVFVLVYWLAWQTGMWRRNFEDMQIAKEAMERVRQIAGEPIRQISKRPKLPDPRWDCSDYWNVLWTWSRGSQLAFTFGFAFMAAITVWYRTMPVVCANATKSNASIQSSQSPSQTSTSSKSPNLNSVPIRP